MNKHIFLTTLLAGCFLTSLVFAQVPAAHSAYLAKGDHIRKFYVSGIVEGMLFSTATIHHDAFTAGVNGTSSQSINSLGTLRFTGFLNVGCNFNFNVCGHFGIYTGVDIKNVGYIEQDNGYTLKRRTYNFGVPLGFKIGRMAKNNQDHSANYFSFGGGLDAPFNYNEKFFHDRTNKTRTLNEWFSDRTPAIMPYAFIGGTFDRGISIKLQYYPNNFLNQDYKDSYGNKPNAGTVVNLVYFSVGFPIWIGSGHQRKMNEYPYKVNRETAN